MNKRKMKKHQREIELKNKLVIANRRADELYDHQNFVAATNRLLRNELENKRNQVRCLQERLEFSIKESAELRDNIDELKRDNFDRIRANRHLFNENRRLNNELEKANRSIVDKIKDWWSED